ncbi:hypothetical protein Tco_0990087 [Tanacetum coccineum]|uniref:Secreted protein n=1 Tax=Tanacetum coccineum TaxID=301880 RepID=A0ABQ5EVI0_9ASTR
MGVFVVVLGLHHGEHEVAGQARGCSRVCDNTTRVVVSGGQPPSAGAFGFCIAAGAFGFAPQRECLVCQGFMAASAAGAFGCPGQPRGGMRWFSWSNS